MQAYLLQSTDHISQSLVQMKLVLWTDVLRYVQQLPYGRNSNRHDVDLVLLEKKGTCSSKHAFLKKLAERNQIPHVKLILSFYKMNEKNTKQIGKILSENQLDYIPEAHCYLNINGTPTDLTSTESDINLIKNDILFEEEIAPEQVNQYKVNKHQIFISQWIKEQDINKSFENVWRIREQCIHNIEKSYM